MHVMKWMGILWRVVVGIGRGWGVALGMLPEEVVVAVETTVQGAVMGQRVIQLMGAAALTELKRSDNHPRLP